MFPVIALAQRYVPVMEVQVETIQHHETRFKLGFKELKEFHRFDVSWLSTVRVRQLLFCIGCTILTHTINGQILRVSQYLDLILKYTMNLTPNREHYVLTRLAVVLPVFSTVSNNACTLISNNSQRMGISRE